MSLKHTTIAVFVMTHCTVSHSFLQNSGRYTVYTVQYATSNTLVFHSEQPCLITMTKEVIKCWAFYKMIVSWQSLCL